MHGVDVRGGNSWHDRLFTMLHPRSQSRGFLSPASTFQAAGFSTRGDSL